MGKGKIRKWEKAAAAGMAVILTLGMAACGSSGTSGSASGTSSTGSASSGEAQADSSFKGQTLNIYAWPEYLPDDVISDFEKEYGVTVNLTTYDSNEEMLAKVQSSKDGTYDIVMPSDYEVKEMAADGLLAKLDYDTLTNFSNLDEEYLDQEFDPDNVYSVPYAPGEIIPCYDTAVLGDGAITSLADLFESKYENGIVVLDGMKEVIGMANLSVGNDLNESGDAALDKTAEALEKLKPNIYAMAFESAQQYLLDGEVAVGYMFNGNVAMAQMENDNIKPVWPTEGGYIWIDNFCVLSSSKKQDLANTFINYILEPEVDAKCREEIPSTDPNKAGWALVDDSLKDTALVIPEDAWEKGEYAALLDDETSQRYSEMWTEFTK